MAQLESWPHIQLVSPLPTFRICLSCEISGDFKIICIYGGVGISSSTSNLQLNGYYPFAEVQATQIIVTDETAKEDPIDISIKSSDGSATKPRLNAGFRLKFAIVTIHFDYTYANYSVASAGLGINFR